MIINFDDPSYLRNGSPIQRMGWGILSTHRVLELLRPYHPAVAGTLPLDLFIEGKSDIDIVCEARAFGEFEEHLRNCFSSYPRYSFRQKNLKGTLSCIASFHLENFPIEIVAQPLPVQQQVAYRHMMIEHQLMERHGMEFKNQIQQLKNQGIKTEPAFAAVLKLQGDPYDALLKLEDELS